MTTEEQIQRFIELGVYDKDCPECAVYMAEHRRTGSEPMMPSHTAKPKCESGQYPHCSCGVCF